MAGTDPAVRKETGYIAVWTVLLSLVMEAVFLILRQWDLSVLLGNLGGAALAIGNFLLLAVIVSRALQKSAPEEAARKVKASATLRLLGVAAACALLIGVAHTHPIATLLPLVFPRVGLFFRPMADKRKGGSPTEPEGSDLID